MPLPPGIETVVVTINAPLYPTGGLRRGQIKFKPAPKALVSADEDAIIAGPVVVAFDGVSSSAQTIELLATDAAGVLPSGWTYLVEERWADAPSRSYSIALPAANAAVNFADLVPTSPAAGEVPGIGAFGQELVASPDAPAARTALGLGSAALADVSAFDVAGSAAAAQAASQVATLDYHAAPSGQLSFAQVGSVSYVPTAIGTDGRAYGTSSEISSVLIRSNDGFATIESSYDLADAGAVDPVLFVTRVAEGYVAVTSDSIVGDGTRGAIWFSPSFNAGWSKRQDLTAGRGTARIAIGRPEWDPVTGHTIWGVGEYSQVVGADHHLWLTRDGGSTWIDSFNRAAVDAAANNHMHAWAFDPVMRRMWLSRGDGKNAFFAFSDDLGATWSPIVANGTPVPTSTPATLYHQSPILIAAERYLAACPDAGDTGTCPSAVWAIEKSAAGVVAEALRVVNFDGHRQYAASPYAMSTDRSRVYMLFPQSPTLGLSNQVVVAASGDGGRSWHKVYTGASVLGDDYGPGIVGPDAAGRLFISLKPSGDTVRKLLVAFEPTWSLSSGGARRTGTADLKAAMVQAGILAGGGASPLNLNGGKVTAGSAALDGQGAAITMGAGVGDVAFIDTKSGTGQIRFRIAGGEVFRYDANNIQLQPGKSVQFDPANGPSIKGGTGSPEGVVTSRVGSLYLRSDGGAGTSLYIKQSGTGNTGWVAVTP